MARHETVNVLGTDYELQSVSPQWYFEQNDKCGMTGSGSRDTARYMDIMFKHICPVRTVVINRANRNVDKHIIPITYQYSLVL